MNAARPASERRIEKVTIRFVMKSSNSDALKRQILKRQILKRFSTPPDKAILDILLENQERLHNWIYKEKRNLGSFLEDPVTALQKAGIVPDDLVFQNARRIRQENLTKGDKLPSMNSEHKWELMEFRLES